MTERPVAPSVFDDPAPHAGDDRVLQLSRSIERLRAWLIALTLIMVLTLCGPVALVGIGAIIGLNMESDGPSQTAVRRDLAEALDVAPTDVKIREVKASWIEDPFPFSFFDDEKALAVEVPVGDSGVVVAELIGSGSVYSVADLVPTNGSLMERLTHEQYRALLDAYAGQTNDPLGSVSMYVNSLDYSDGRPKNLEFDGKMYPATSVWSAQTGFKVTADKVDMSEDAYQERDVRVFYLDKENGTFTYLGTEKSTSEYYED